MFKRRDSGQVPPVLMLNFHPANELVLLSQYVESVLYFKSTSGQ